MSQVNTSVCFGMGKVGKRRKQFYLERMRSRGYTSFSKFVKDLLDRELALESPKIPRQKTRQAIAQEVQ